VVHVWLVDDGLEDGLKMAAIPEFRFVWVDSLLPLVFLVT